MKRIKTMRKTKVLIWTVFSLLLLMPAVHAQEGNTRKITGTVKDDAGNPLPGVTVEAKGTSTLTSTNNLGLFSIEVGSDARVLIFSSVGMGNKEVTIGSANVMEVTLETSTKKLDEVVVIGYGTAKRGNLTTAQTSVSAKDIDKTVNTTIEQAIQGRAAGVYITQNSGQPGGGISVNIRGVNSINGSNEPLYVIDGVQIEGESVSFGAQSSSNPLSGLNPSDIEDITRSICNSGIWFKSNQWCYINYYQTR